MDEVKKIVINKVLYEKSARATKNDWFGLGAVEEIMKIIKKWGMIVTLKIA